MQQINLLIRPILLVVGRQFNVEAPQDLAKSELHFCPGQPVMLSVSSVKQLSELRGYARLSDAVPRSDHERPEHLLVVSEVLGICLWEPSFGNERQRVHEIGGEFVGGLLGYTHASLVGQISLRGDPTSRRGQRTPIGTALPEITTSGLSTSLGTDTGPRG